MRFLKNYKSYNESVILQSYIFDIDESLSISNDILLLSIKANEIDMFDTFKLPKDFYNGRLSLDFLSNNIEFINSLTSIALKKSQVNTSDDFQCFINKDCKWMFIYNIESNELENPVFILFQSWNETLKEWTDVKLYKINENIQRFYDKLSGKTIEILDGDDNYIYKTTNKNEWTLQNIEKENDTYKRYFRSDELESLLSDRKVIVNII